MSTVSCPDCGHSDVRVSLTCHTWPGGTRSDGSTQWMSCQGCDSALEYWCACWLDDDATCECNWNYTHGLNKHNPRYAHEQESRPDWLEPDLKFTKDFPIAHEGVEWQ